MCGRYRIKDAERLAAHLRSMFNLSDGSDEAAPPRYNVAPSQECPVIVMDDEGDVLPISTKMQWGIRPERSGEDLSKFFLVNIRSETATTNKLVGDAVQKRRCLVPADGFYEWLRFDEKTKYPFDIHLKGDRPFVIAGIYEAATEARPGTFAVLTTRPNELMAKIHDRMPAILNEAAAKRWLRPGPLASSVVAALTTPHEASDMEAVPISALVNNAKNEMPEILEPTAPPPPRRPPQIQGELF